MRISAAEKLLKSLGISEPKDIDLEAIAYCCGAEIKERVLSGCEAQIAGHKDKAIITVNQNCMPERKRFSVGHELGHWEHHRGKSFVCRKDDIGNQDKQLAATHPEKVADDYAADLLMPAYIFEPRAKKSQMVSFDVVLALKDDFSTSITATALRYIQCSSHPSMLICHDARGRKWFRRGKDIPQTLFPQDELDAESFAMDVIHGGKTQTRPSLIGADAWFDKRGADQYELYEHSIRIHDGRILTLLSWKDEDMLERYAA